MTAGPGGCRADLQSGNNTMMGNGPSGQTPSESTDTRRIWQQIRARHRTCSAERIRLMAGQRLMPAKHTRPRQRMYPGVYVTNGGVLTLINPTITTSGDSSSTDASSFYGLNGAVLVNDGSSVTIKGGTITSTGSGANGVIPTGTGSTATLTDVTITASGGAAHGVMATQGGTLILNNVTIATTGGSGAPLATDRGSGTVTVTGGTMTSGTGKYPGIYSTGVITVTGATITSTGSRRR